MNEDYIKQFRKQPEAVLVEKIHVRLERKERIQLIKRSFIRSVVLAIFIFGMLFAFSPTVRADVKRIAEEIAGLQYEITSKCPGCTDDVITIEPEILSLEDARSRFKSPILLPTYVPQGYERLIDLKLFKWEVELEDGIFPELVITWEKREENQLVGYIDLSIKTECPSDYPSCGWVVGNEALEEITLKGKPAVIVRGGWNHDTKQYDLSAGVHIQWRYDENTVYQLSSLEGMLDELSKMAESIP